MKTKKQINIAIFDKETDRDTVIERNGLALDSICINGYVEEDLTSGSYILEADFLINDDGLYKYIEEENILKVRVDYGYEIFRIARIKTNTINRRTNVKARQITIPETLGMWLDDVRAVNTNGQGALSYLINNSVSKGSKEIFVNSDISKISTGYYPKMNVYKAIHDCDQSFTSRWGGEVQRRGYNLNINNRIGSDRGVSIRSGKNLTGFERSTDIDRLCTRAKGIGFNGITHDNYIDSPNIDKYNDIYTNTFKYEDVKVKDESNPEEGFDTLKEAQIELEKRVKNEFEVNHVDELRAEYNLSFIYLEQTEEYKNLKVVEKVYLGDTVTVHEDILDIDIKVRAIKRKYDFMLQRVVNMTLSNIPLSEKKATSSGSIFKQLQEIVKKTENNSVQEYIQSMINSGNTDSYVLHLPNESIYGDTKDINTMTELFRLNKNGLAFSQTGYYGDYIYGFTRDGKLNASIIQTGILTAILIQSLDGGCSINLETGEVNFNKGIIRGTNCSFDLNTGELRSEYRNSVTGMHNFSLKNGTVKSTEYVRLSGEQGVILLEEDAVNGIVASMFIQAMAVFGFDTSLTISTPIMDIWDKGNYMQAFRIKSNSIALNGNSTSIGGNLNVYGNKNCIQKTKEYGDVPFYANEDINSLLTKTPIDEILETTLQNTGKYKCIVPISKMIKECINTDMPYTVWFSKLGQGDIWVSNTYPGYFVVESDRPVRFKYKLEGRRKGFEEMNEELVLKKAYETKIKGENEVA